MFFGIRSYQRLLKYYPHFLYQFAAIIYLLLVCSYFYLYVQQAKLKCCLLHTENTLIIHGERRRHSTMPFAK